METIQHLLTYIINLDDYLVAFVSTYGVWAYVILFAIIFCETGLVIVPFLPGDSLLFAAGSIAAKPSEPLKIQLLFVLLLLASILGNKVNYLIGRAVGPKVFTAKKSWLLNKNHLEKAHQFYERHGGKTIILARFLPIIRTFAPFVAGVGYMSLSQFSVFNVVSAVLWVGTMLGFGYFFGTLPFIRENFSVIVCLIIGVSLLPPVIAFLYHKVLSFKKA